MPEIVRNSRSKSKYTSLSINVLERISDSFYAIDQDWHFTYINRQGGVLLQRNPEDLIGKNIWEAFPQLVGTEIELKFRQGMNKGQFQDFEWLCDINGLWYYIRVYPYDDAILVFGQDISGRKKLEAAMREIDARFHSVLDNSCDLIYRINLQTDRFDYVSPSAEEILGYTPDELMAMDVTAVQAMIHPDDLPAFQAANSSLKDIGKTKIGYRQRNKNGNYLWLSNSMSIVKDSQGQPIYRTGNIRDITERKKADEALKESEERYRAFFENSLDAVMIASPDGSIQAANSAACRMFGMTEQELLLGGRESIADKSDPRLNSFLEERARTGKFSGELRLKRKDGTVFPAEFSTALFKDRNGQTRTAMIIRDITERKQAEEALTSAKDELEIKVKGRTAELRKAYEKAEADKQIFDALMSNIPSGIIITGGPPDFPIIKISSYITESTGLPASTFLGQKAGYNYKNRGLCLPDGKPIRTQQTPLYRASHKREKVRGEEFNIQNSQGQPITVSVSASPICDSQGNIIAAISTWSDITERKVMEEALKESEEKYRLLIENANEAVVVLQDYLLKFFNSKMIEMTGYSREELAFRKFSEFIHPEDREMLINRDLAGLQGKTALSSYECRLIHKNGKTLWIYLNAVLIAWEGRPATLSIMSDITEHKQAMVALEESESNLKLLWNSMVHGVVYQDSHGKIIRMNPAAENILGKTPEQFLGMKSEDAGYDTIRPDGSLFPGIEHPSMISLKTGQEIHGVVMGVYNPKEKSYRWININAIPLFHAGENKPYQVYTIFDDITELKKVEDALAKSRNDLAQANEQLKGYSQRITQVQEDERKRIAYELHDDTAQYLGILKMQIGALANSEEIRSSKVKEKLQYLERDANKAFDEVRRYSHELRPVVLEHQGLSAALEQIADDYNKLGPLIIEVNVAGREPRLSEEVKLGFFRIAQEALNNTRKHSKANQATIELRFNQKHVWMTVSDNGIGFDIGEAFKKGSYKGSLGLVSMRERAEMIHGALQIESGPGKGTKVTVEVLTKPGKIIGIQ